MIARLSRKEITMSNPSIHVVPSPNGGWDIKKDGAERRSGHEATQNEAIARAKELAQKQKTELLIHGKNGQIRQKFSYGSDPFPPKG